MNEPASAESPVMECVTDFRPTYMLGAMLAGNFLLLGLLMTAITLQSVRGVMFILGAWVLAYVSNLCSASGHIKAAEYTSLFTVVATVIAAFIILT